MSDSSSYQQLVSSPVLGAAAAVAVGAAYLVYTQQQRNKNQKPTKCPVKQREGVIEITDMHVSPEERRRDFYRFYKSKSVYVKSASGEVKLFKSANDGTPDTVVRDLVKLLPKGTDIDALVYSLSTSLGMEILLKLGVIPPMISQPLFAVHTSTGVIELVGFIGDNLRGADKGGPDTKYTDWFIRISVSPCSKEDCSKVRYAVSPRPHNCSRTSDLI